MNKLRMISLPAFCVTVSSMLLLVNCGNNPSSEKKEVVIKKDSVKAVNKKPAYDWKYNSLARFIAGLGSDSIDKSYAELEKKPEWIKYQKTFDSSWTILETPPRLTPGGFRMAV